MRPALALTAIAALALAIAPALAEQQRRQVRTVGPSSSAQPYAPSWSGRADPSFGNRIGIDNERANGRCVVDLGYGRWEPC
jgi:hypothetical protein